jgi:hypothetical protein
LGEKERYISYKPRILSQPKNKVGGGRKTNVIRIGRVNLKLEVTNQGIK